MDIMPRFILAFNRYPSPDYPPMYDTLESSNFTNSAHTELFLFTNTLGYLSAAEVETPA